MECRGGVAELMNSGLPRTNPAPGAEQTGQDVNSGPSDSAAS